MSQIPGTPQGGRYRFETRIATGGMGEVWRATDEVLGREVAVKVLKPEYADDPTFRSRFRTEARNAAALHHPNVASVFDYGELPANPAEAGGESPRPYLVMELVRGEPLSALLRGGEPMPPDVAANLAAQAADGLAAAHRLGIVHRDVKPANLLVTADRTVKITDFGIARAAAAVTLTRTGQVIGTPQYLSPEQAEGRQATAASDVYSLGVVLYECLAGRRPFDADSPIATALAHLREEPAPLPTDVPEGLRRSVGVALAKDPADRFASVGDFAAALRGGPVPQGASTRVAGTQGGAGVGLGGAAGDGEAARDGAWDDDGTRVLGPPPPVTDAPGDRRRRGSARWLPWVAAALAVLAVVLALARLGGGNPDRGTAAPSTSSSPGSPSRAPSSHATTDTSSPPATRTSTTLQMVTVTKDDYLGRPADEVSKELRALGLRVDDRRVDNPDDQQQGTVADVSPAGDVRKGSTVIVSVYDKPSPTRAPSTTPSTTPSPTPSTTPSTTPSPTPSTTPSATSTGDGGRGAGKGKGNGGGKGGGGKGGGGKGGGGRGGGEGESGR